MELYILVTLLILFFSASTFVFAFRVEGTATRLAAIWRPSLLGSKNSHTEEPSFRKRTQYDSVSTANRTAKILERTSPSDHFPLDGNNDDDDDGDYNTDAKEKENEDYEPAAQIFNPLSFWTERSGRFPRNK